MTVAARQVMYHTVYEPAADTSRDLLPGSATQKGYTLAINFAGRTTQPKTLLVRAIHC